jgi:small subunit ribosomal protein S5
MSFRATVLIGDGKGKVGVGTAKGADVSIAVKKASREAYKNIMSVPITKANTVPYELTAKFKACRVKLLPASAGTGLKAGSSVRQVLELA